MNPVVLKSTAEDGSLLHATFLPGMGMNLISYKKGEREVIDQHTRSEFERRFAGLGALIGPHFYRRNAHTIKPISNSSAFPHILVTQERGDPDPFTHGIGRYAPWNFSATEDQIKGELKGTDKWNDIALSELEGQNFIMRFTAKLDPKGLNIDLSVVSDTASIVGTHYYYSLPQHKGYVTSGIQHKYYDPHHLREVPKEWLSEPHKLRFDLQHECDYAFHPFPHPREAEILLDAIDYRLKINYTCPSQENAWQLYRPANATFVCIEPCSAQDPRHANLTVSSLNIKIMIQ